MQYNELPIQPHLDNIRQHSRHHIKDPGLVEIESTASAEQRDQAAKEFAEILSMLHAGTLIDHYKVFTNTEGVLCVDARDGSRMSFCLYSRPDAGMMSFFESTRCEVD